MCFVPECVDEYPEDDYDQDNEHKLRYMVPHTDLVGYAAEIFKDSLSSFRIVVECRYWSSPDYTLSAVWRGSQEIRFVDYQSDWRMLDIQAQFQKLGRQFSVLATWKPYDFRTGEILQHERVLTDLWSR